ncbi:hypothetical protein [Pseudomonas sp. NPDC088444]|uniref:hypothetical protein n=1 Tax=Pseudomonas sp. NPDC088444 TaxID=3364456 RepID=UPI00384F0A81
MRKRIPVILADIELNERPGPISPLAYVVKKHLEEKSLASAQKKLALGMGYRNYSELLQEGRSDHCDFPPMGSITLHDIEQVFAWGIHTKCGVAYLSALRLARKMDFTKLSIYGYTKDAAVEDVLLPQTEERQSVLSDVGLQNSPITAELIAAGAPPFSYALKASGQDPQLFQMALLVNEAAGLFSQLDERLEEEFGSDGLSAEHRRGRYLRDCLVTSHWGSLKQAIREGFVPAGMSIAVLANSAGEFRGRAVYFEGVGGVVPRIHHDDGVYEDIFWIMVGRTPSSNIEAPSVEGERKGATVFKPDPNGKGRTVYSHVSDTRFALDQIQIKAIYGGDEDLYRLVPKAANIASKIHRLIDTGQSEQVRIEPSMLIKLNHITYRDARFDGSMAMSVGGTFNNGFAADGTLVPKTPANQRFCGEIMRMGEQPLVRDQPWLREDEVPGFLIPAEAFRATSVGFAKGSGASPIIHPSFDRPVPHWATNVHHAFEAAWDRVKRAPFLAVDDFLAAQHEPDRGLSELLPRAVAFHEEFHFAEAIIVLSDAREHALRELRKGLLGRGAVDNSHLHATVKALDSALLALLNALAVIPLSAEADFRPVLISKELTSPHAHAWLVSAATGQPMSDLLRTDIDPTAYSATLSGTDIRKVYSRVISALVLGPAFNVDRRTLKPRVLLSEEVIFSVAYAVLDKKVPLDDAYATAIQLQKAVSKHEQTLTLIGIIGGAERAQIERRRDAAAGGFLHVGSRLSTSTSGAGSGLATSDVAMNS